MKSVTKLNFKRKKKKIMGDRMYTNLNRNGWIDLKKK